MSKENTSPAMEGVGVIDIKLSELSKLPKALKGFSSQMRGTSIAEMSRDMIMQFPVLMSSQIENDHARHIAKALERQYATFMMMTLSSYLDIDSNRYSTIQDFLKDIHNNDNAPSLLNYAIGLGANAATVQNAFKSGMESLRITEDEINALWYGADEEVTLESLNDMYQPNRSNEIRLTRILEVTGPDKIEDNADSAKDPQNTKAAEAGQMSIAQRTFNAGANLDNAANGDHYPAKSSGGQLPRIYENKSLSSLEPTMITATLYLKGEKRPFALGVKTMVRSVTPSAMIYNLGEAVANHQLAFKLVRWTRGEIKFFRDVVFDIANIRRETIAKNQAQSGKDKAGYNYFVDLKDRRRNAKTFVGGGRPLSPISTVVCTKYEVEEIKAQHGIDLEDPKVALQLMDQLYLLGFVIYDPTTGVVETMLDGGATGNDFAMTTIDALRHSAGTTTTVSDMTRFVAELGRFKG